MVEIKGTFTKRGNTNKPVPAAGARLNLTLEHVDPDVEFRVIEGGEEVELYESSYSFLLDHNGAPPSGARVPRTDEVLPPGSTYSLEVEDSNVRNRPIYYFQERVEITGDGPVDLTPPIEAEPEVFVPKPRRQMPALRKLGTNYRGFYGIAVNCPETVDGASCTSPINGTFSVFAFTLPIKAVVNAVSIIVNGPVPDKHVLIGLYDTSGRKVCAASIPASGVGVATAEFDRTYDLTSGEYLLAWSTDGVEVQGLGADYREQFRLMNGGEGGVVAGIAGEAGARSILDLPEKLGKIEPTASFVPPLVYFKS